MDTNSEFWAVYAAGGADTEDACRLYDGLEAASLSELIGTWKGREFPTGHPLDGVLSGLNWYGKAFHDAENVDPLLFELPDGEIAAMDPVPLMDKRKLLKATGGKARMRMMEHRGVLSAVMVYDNLPIHDHFRKVNEHVLLGMMDWKGDANPFFFILEKVE
ncbi:hypothetical protein BN1080_00533 [Planococcus massiliensis]|uniref:GXWXG protein n=1 Tax=Planococcus massiliensis TaxID=1499687 RepID=A0A098EIJ1_9BACL|nr:DUF4334 domain-containing protein [Planococcus massiliensis]CEG21620.1 hypothetical protein BN1080_00533 [Planococcus massiliensis]